MINILPERCEHSEDRRPPEIGKKRDPKQDGKVRQKPRSRGAEESGNEWIEIRGAQ